MFQFRAISNSAVRYASKLHAIKKFPVTLCISFPPYDEPTLVNFTSFEQIAEFLEPKNILRHPTTGHALHATEVKKIDPGIVYDIIDTDFPFCGKRVQVGDRFFEGKSSLALWSILKEEDPGVLRLPSVIKDKKRDVAEWEAIFQLSDGCIVFLEAKYRMSKVSRSIGYLKNVYTQLDYISSGAC